MNTRRLLATILAMALGVAPQIVSTANAGGTYSATLILPTVGQVLYPGQHIRIERKSVLPNINLGVRVGWKCGCRWNGGSTFTIWISPWLNPKAQYFDWTVPNTPTNATVMDIRFGCEQRYPESYSPQPASTFVIAKAAPHRTHYTGSSVTGPEFRAIRRSLNDRKMSASMALLEGAIIEQVN